MGNKVQHYIVIRVSVLPCRMMLPDGPARLATLLRLPGGENCNRVGTGSPGISVQQLRVLDSESCQRGDHQQIVFETRWQLCGGWQHFLFIRFWFFWQGCTRWQAWFWGSGSLTNPSVFVECALDQMFLTDSLKLQHQPESQRVWELSSFDTSNDVGWLNWQNLIGFQSPKFICVKKWAEARILNQHGVGSRMAWKSLSDHGLIATVNLSFLPMQFLFCLPNSPFGKALTALLLVSFFRPGGWWYGQPRVVGWANTWTCSVFFVPRQSATAELYGHVNLWTCWGIIVFMKDTFACAFAMQIYQC